MATCIIWGASGGIGLALAQLLVEKGWDVAGVGRRVEPIEALTRLAFSADVASPSSVQAAVSAMSMDIGEADWWVYAAGDILSSPVKEQSPETWKRILDANLNGAFHALHYSLPLLAPAAPLAFIGANHERMRLPGLSAYSASKAGLEALAETARKELRREVLVARPGAVDTPLWTKVPFRLPANALKPADLAEKLLAAYHGSQTGLMDL